MTATPKELLLHSATREGESASLIAVTPESAQWTYCSLNVVSLASGGIWKDVSGTEELGLVVLSGSCEISTGDATWMLDGRTSIFDGQPWALYLPILSEYEITATADLEIAICGAQATKYFPPKLITPADVDVEIRGAGNAARQINHIIKPDFPADKLLIVEVFTPSGNWSSFPPHKHDVSRMPEEALLEEIYYYRIDPTDGFALQRLYTADGRIDEAFVIRDGDLLLVPEGYHAFAVAHGYTGYYLNILAGPEPVRTMQPADDPVHHWTRATWNDEQNGGATHWREIDQNVNRGAGQRKP
jgi:5-deoxy-glucuronate isomerase